MKKIDKYIEIVVTSVKDLPSMTPRSSNMIKNILCKYYSKVEITVVNNKADLANLVIKNPDLVFMGMKKVPVIKNSDNFVWASDYLERNGILTTGSRSSSIELEANKIKAKDVVLAAGLATSPYFVARKGQYSDISQIGLNFPLFVKPTNRGGSKGIDEHSLVHTNTQLKTKIDSIHRFLKTDALVEEYLPGREFSVAVIKQKYSDELLALPIEITNPNDVNGNSFLSESVKAEDTEATHIVVDDNLRGIVNTFAICVFNALNARDYGRVDMRFDVKGKPHFIEANLLSGLSDHGYLARCFMLNEKISHAEMIFSIADNAFDRDTAIEEKTPILDILAVNLGSQVLIPETI